MGDTARKSFVATTVAVVVIATALALGHAVGLSPLIVLVTVSAVGLLFGAPYVLLSVPIAAVLATLVDVIVLDKDPADEDPPAVLFPAKEAETGS